MENRAEPHRSNPVRLSFLFYIPLEILNPAQIPTKLPIVLPIIEDIEKAPAPKMTGT